MATAYIGNDNLIEVDGLQNAATDAYLNSATVTVTLVDQAGTQIVGQAWPTTLAYVAASNGKYRGVLNDLLSLTHDQCVIAKVTADAGADLKAYWEIPVQAQVRTS